MATLKFTTAELAELKGVHPTTIRKQVAKGHLEHVVESGRFLFPMDVAPYTSEDKAKAEDDVWDKAFEAGFREAIREVVNELQDSGHKTAVKTMRRLYPMEEYEEYDG